MLPSSLVEQLPSRVFPAIETARAPKLKVLYVIGRAEHGGAQVHVLNLVDALKGEVEPVIATGEDGFLCDEARRHGIRVHRMKHLVRDVRPWSDAHATAELVSIIRREKPDLVHAHTSKAGLVGRAAATITGTPRVFTAHSWSFVEQTSWVQDRIAVAVERLAAMSGGPMVMVSETNRQMALSRGIGRPENLWTVWNGVRDTLVRANHGPKHTPRIVMVAHFVPQKDHACLLRALSEVDQPWTLTLVGDGPLLDKSKNLAQQLGIFDRVEFTGATNRVSELLSRSDIFVLSSFFEGLPLSVLEAMRAGLPVVASDAGGTAEAITDGVTGYVVPVADYAIMRDRLKLLLENADLRKWMGVAARRRFERDFLLETSAARTFEVYSAALNRPSFNSLNEKRISA